MPKLGRNTELRTRRPYVVTFSSKAEPFLFGICRLLHTRFLWAIAVIIDAMRVDVDDRIAQTAGEHEIKE